jgi:putative ABC transport system permease protein
MLTNYIKIAIRNLLKNKGFTFINIFGLATSMSICLLIILFIIDQDKKDEYHADSKYIYRVLTNYENAEKGRTQAFATSPYELGDLLIFNQKGIESNSQIVKTAGNIKFDNRLFNYNGLFVSPNFLEFFHYDLLNGEKINALSQHNSAVISKALAINLFGKKDAINQLVNINGESFKVTGVIDNELVKSHIEFDVLLSIDSYLNNLDNSIVIKNWDKGSKIFYNYVTLKKDTPVADIELFLSSIASKFSEEIKPLYSFGFQKVIDINLGQLVKNELGTTTPNIVAYFFAILALVVMLSASFNYMNLSIARALKRAKEVGVRKIVGANKKHIIIQFLIESQIVMIISLILGVLLLEILVPLFNDLKVLRDVDGAITLNYRTHLNIYIYYLLFSVGLGLIAGIYPAIHLSSFKSLNALKGKVSKGESSSQKFRKVLVFLQYSFSIIFIITTIVLYQQANALVSADYGFDKKNMINVPISNINYEIFREELLKRSEIVGVSAVSHLPVLSALNNIHLNTNGSQDLTKTSSFSVDPNTIENLDLKLIAGRNFQQKLISDQDNAMILNKLAVEELGFKNIESAIGQTIQIKRTDNLGDHLSKGRIIGVVDNFVHQFIFVKSGPLAMFYKPEAFTTAIIKINGSDTKNAALIIGNIWDTFDNTVPFDYSVYDYVIADFDAEFKDLVYLVGLVALLAIIIACLGQFSMVVQHIELKLKEIGIRKVLGSSIGNLTILLSKGFITIIFVAIAVATPLAWKLNASWTQKLAIDADVSIFTLALGVFITLILSGASIIFLVIKAALANPVKSLRYNN